MLPLYGLKSIFDTSEQITFQFGLLCISVLQQYLSLSTCRIVSIPACSKPRASPPPPANNSIAEYLEIFVFCLLFSCLFFLKSIISSGVTLKTSLNSKKVDFIGLYLSDNITYNLFLVINTSLDNYVSVFIPTLFIAFFTRSLFATVILSPVMILY